MQLTIRPVVAPHHEIDVTKALTAALAEVLWKHHGGNEQLNWLEAELHLQRLLAPASSQNNGLSVRESELVDELLGIAAATQQAAGASATHDAAFHTHRSAKRSSADRLTERGCAA